MNHQRDTFNFAIAPKESKRPSVRRTVVMLAISIIALGSIGTILWDANSDKQETNASLAQLLNGVDNDYEPTRDDIVSTTVFPTPEVSQLTDEEIITNIRAVLEVPADEKPTIATVSDPAAMGNQEFFQYAKPGDKLIVYNQAGKSILYYPTSDRIIEVAPLVQ